MKVSYYFCIVSLFLFAPSVYPQIPPNIIYGLDGIPLIAPFYHGFADINQSHYFDSAKSMGVDVMHSEIFASNEINFYVSKNMPVIAVNYLDMDWIQYYTDGAYTIWEGEGNSEPNSAELTHDNSLTEVFYDASGRTSLKTRINTNHNSFYLTSGPYYNQVIKVVEYPDTPYINYYADFELKLEIDSTYPPLDNPDEEICILEVTQSRHSTVNQLECTYVLPKINLGTTYQRILKRKDFNLNNFNTFTYEYQLADTNCSEGWMTRQYIEFKVLWKGSPQYLLSFDKVTVYDDRGEKLKLAGNGPTDPFTRIKNQVNALNNHYPLIAGAICRDEPESIDNFECIRIVDSLLTFYTPTRPITLWLQLMGHWDGVWENRYNSFGAQKLSPWVEMKKRISDISGRDLNVWQDYYYWLPNDNPATRDNEIVRAGDLNYKQAFSLNKNFGVSLQCGAQLDAGIAWERTPSGYEFLFEINYALLYGAKFFIFYDYFAHTDTCDKISKRPYHALVDWTVCPPPPPPDPPINYPDNLLLMGAPTYTPRWDSMKVYNSIMLKGDFGKKLKKLTPVFQAHLDIHNYFPPILDPNGISGNYLDYITYDSGIQTRYHLDYGFFTDVTEPGKNYLMVVNRPYETYDYHKIGLRNLNGYTNWNLKTFSTYWTDIYQKTLVVNDGKAYFKDTLRMGEAELYSIYPVVKFGGELIANETISETISLTEENLIIKSGATLTIISGTTYQVYKNIIIESGGTLNLDANSIINFEDGAKLVIHGNVVSNSSGDDRPILDFNSESNSGIVLETRTNISNLIIKNADPGISIISNIEVDTTISLQIINNNFVNCTPGISAVNSPLLLIQGNYFNSPAVLLSNVQNFNIIDNTCTMSTQSEWPGLEFYSSSGRIINNSVIGFGYGVYMGNSFISFGNNVIKNCFYPGLYVGNGSIADLKAAFVRVPCSPAVVYYPIKGFNIIKDNDIVNEYSGAEIFVNDGTIELDYGLNTIRDDSHAGGLIEGSTDELWARMNYWGSEGAYPRSASLTINYDPAGIYEPNTSINCPLVIKTTDNIP